jgi:hypothetical protein
MMNHDPLQHLFLAMPWPDGGDRPSAPQIEDLAKQTRLENIRLKVETMWPFCDVASEQGAGRDHV